MCCNEFVQTPSIGLVQEVLGWGWLSWGNAGHTLGPTTLGSLVEIGIAQICCAEKCFLAVTKTGKVYTCLYTTEGQVRETEKNWLLITVTTCYKCQFPAFTLKIIYTVTVIIFDDFCFINLTMLEIYSNLFLQGPVLIESLAHKCEIIKIATNPECKHFMALSREGEVYSWGSGDGGKLGHGDNKYDIYCATLFFQLH